MEKVFTEKAPATIGPYSQAIKSGGFLFASGQIPVDPATGEIRGKDIASQTEQSCKNIEAVLKESGTSFEKVV